MTQIGVGLGCSIMKRLKGPYWITLFNRHIGLSRNTSPLVLGVMLLLNSRIRMVIVLLPFPVFKHKKVVFLLCLVLCFELFVLAWYLLCFVDVFTLEVFWMEPDVVEFLFLLSPSNLGL